MSSSNAPSLPYRHLFAGAVAGTGAALLTCPLDVLKTRLQSSEFAAIGGMNLRSLTAKVVREEGLSALWKGAGAIVAGVGPARAIHFFAYAQAKQALDAASVSGMQKHVMAATLAGLLSVTSTSPVWVIKTRLQLQHNASPLRAAVQGMPGVTVTAHGPEYRGFFHAAAEIWRREGIRGMFKGVSASYLGVAESVIQFTMYEGMKASALSTYIADTYGSGAQHASFFVMGATAKLSASIITYPHEVIRTRLRQVNANKYHGIIQTFKVILREEGWRGLYGGMATHLLRTVPNAAIMFLIVEALTDTGI